MTASDATRIAINLWLDIIQYHRQGDSLGEIERWLTDKRSKSNRDYWEQYPRRCYRFRAGTEKPGKKFIDRVESKVPGTKRVIQHPLWWVLDNPEPNLESVHQQMRELEPNVYRRLFQKSPKHGPSPRRTLRTPFQIGNIGRISNLDALAGLLLLLRETELSNQQGYNLECQEQILELLERLSSFSPYNAIAEPLSELIIERFLKPDPVSKNASPTKAADIQRKAFENALTIRAAMQQGYISSSPQDQLDFLYRLQLERSRYKPPDPQFDLFPIRLCSYTSEPCRSKQHRQVDSNSRAVQVRQYTQLRALDGFAHCTGHT
ncbi:hypothetical protein [Microbulbifer spongiae]|uniref:Uncharacterized protein n=1 Tax=Microbulbifer spongiae TaxID=2944933 RepID=A0ABY9EDI8_9GAMM|nr:hypothetical protein [Microbulbifer sp. MI-G]WKD51045.1 hypothetical protein M8T91_06385 [Microbulbifer sp. MI-G]